MSDATARIIVSGLVQGVGYRFFAARKAREMGVRGHARNLPGGQVEVFAQGERGMISEFVSALRAGPRSADVTGVSLDWIDSTDRPEGFEIR